MDFKRFRPKRSAQRWLEGAPEYVIACYDNGGRTLDRYSVLFGGSMWTPDHARLLSECGMNPRLVDALSMSQTPEFALGVSIFAYALRGPHMGKKVRWLDLPQNIRTHAKARAQEAVDFQEAC